MLFDCEAGADGIGYGGALNSGGISFLSIAFAICWPLFEECVDGLMVVIVKLAAVKLVDD